MGKMDKMDWGSWAKHTLVLASFQTVSLKQCQARAVKAFPPFNTLSNSAGTDSERFKDLFKSEVG